MDPQEHRDGDVGRDDQWQWCRGLPIRKRVLVAALHFVAGFVLLLAVYFPLEYFFGFAGDQRGNVAGSLADAAERSALWSAGYVVLTLLQWRLQRWMRWLRGDE